MSKLVAPIQPLILTVAGQKPTIPTPATARPSDDAFDVTTNIMVGQVAYNVKDDIFYYRSSSAIKNLNGGEITVDDVELWRSNKTYTAGDTFVSYSNPASSNPQFQSPGLYRCIITTLAGESPEIFQSKWEFQGQSTDLSSVLAENVIYNNTDSGLTADNVKTAIDELASQVAGASSNGANVGTGEGVYKQNAGTVLQFKTLSGTGKVTVSSVGDNININSDGEANSASNAGTVADGSGVFKGKVSEDLVFKRIKAGTDISVSESADSLSVSANVPLKSVTNLGTGSAIFSNIVSNAARLRTLLAGTNVAISITQDDEIQISCTAQNNTASNVGTGSGLFLQKVAQDLQFKSLIAGSNIAISSQANTLTLSSPANVHNVSNIGGGAELFKQIVANSAQFKTLSAGTGISINASGDAIVISSNGGIPTGIEGNVLYHDGTEWIVLEIGTNGQLLTSNGNVPVWNDAPISLPSGTQGDILYNDGTDWVVLNAGTAGYALTANGPGTDPTWEVVNTGIAEAPTGNLLPFIRREGEWFDSSQYEIHSITGNAQVVNIDMRDQKQLVIQLSGGVTSLAAFTTNLLTGRYFSKVVVVDNQTAAAIPATNLNADYYESGLSATYSFPVGVTRIYYKYMDGKLFAGLGNVVSSGGGHTIKGSAGPTLPNQPVLKFGAGFLVEDDAVNEMTVVRVDVFSESLAFVNGSMTFDKNKYIQSHQITATFQFTKSAGTHYSGAMIEACLIADGVTGHKPTFSADFNIQYDNWDNTNGAKNLVRMRYLPEGILTEIRKI